MTNSELAAYNYGRRLAQEAVRLASEGRGDQMPASAVLGDQELTALERLGLQRWQELVIRGGREILAASDAMP